MRPPLIGEINFIAPPVSNALSSHSKPPSRCPLSPHSSAGQCRSQFLILVNPTQGRLSFCIQPLACIHTAALVMTSCRSILSHPRATSIYTTDVCRNASHVFTLRVVRRVQAVQPLSFDFAALRTGAPLITGIGRFQSFKWFQPFKTFKTVLTRSGTSTFPEFRKRGNERRLSPAVGGRLFFYQKADFPLLRIGQGHQLRDGGK